MKSFLQWDSRAFCRLQKWQYSLCCWDLISRPPVATWHKREFCDFFPWAVPCFLYAYSVSLKNKKTLGGWAWNVHATKDHLMTDTTACKGVLINFHLWFYSLMVMMQFLTITFICACASKYDIIPCFPHISSSNNNLDQKNELHKILLFIIFLDLCHHSVPGGGATEQETV